MPSRTAPAPWRRGREALLQPGGLLLAAVLLLAVAAFVQPMFDPDFWWHLRVGLHILSAGVPLRNDYTYTAAGHIFITQEWGTEALFALLFPRAGMLPILLLFGIVSWLGLVLGLVRAHRPGISLGVLGVGGALWVLSSLQIWGPRSQTFTFALAALLVWLLDRHRRRGGWTIWLAVPLIALWGNLHGGFIFGLGVFALVVLGEAIANRLRSDAPLVTRAQVPWPRWRARAGALAVAALAAMLNPNGPAVYRYPLELLSSRVAQQVLQEWQSPNFHDRAMWPLLVLILTTLLVASRAVRTGLTDWLLAIAGLALALYGVRNIPLFGLLVLPLWVDGADAWWGQLGGRSARPASRPVPQRARRARAVTAGVVLALVALVTAARVVVSVRSPENSPTGSAYPDPVARLLCSGPPARVLAPYGSSGWLLYRLDRAQPGGRSCRPDRVFIFGEVNVMGPAVLTAYLTAVGGGPAALRVLRRTGTTVVWQGRGSALGLELASEPGWRCIFADRADVVYAAASSAAAWHTPAAERARCPG